MFPFRWEGVVPLLRVALGFSAASLGGFEHFGVVSFSLTQRWIGLPATGLAQGPQEGGSHRKINARSLPLVLYIERKFCLNN